ncbi:hypothetical protein SeMB42_g02364 [Synchytrium endobioticum]|uniref:L-ascorbate oxidase n=1 Tax=Synchytrium endobioticum TaxID=286115 RepID=A0A507D791_9FUNG|nr:hypothetical protein SeLEV6574_g02695 [Synchytrium endobioticum]TPX50090.1 hypothetical protein SeMB42_g02364 [Synchytrium endobioticum]
MSLRLALALALALLVAISCLPLPAAASGPSAASSSQPQAVKDPFSTNEYLGYVNPATVSNNVRALSLTLTRGALNPDGRTVDFAILVNGMFQPAIVAQLGEVLSVTVVNKLEAATSMHWHGMFQTGSTDQDGSVSVNQCPIPPGATYTYTFKLTQNGTFWYHAHANAQYGEGARGPLIIKAADEPADVQDVVIATTDWFHTPATTILSKFLDGKNNPDGVEPKIDSVLINGLGQYNCSTNSTAPTPCPNAKYYTLRLNSQNKYRIRLLNMAAAASFTIDIPGIIPQVTELDGVATQVALADEIQLDVAQRVSFYLSPKEQGLPSATYTIKAGIGGDEGASLLAIGYIVIDGNTTQALNMEAGERPRVLYGDGFIRAFGPGTISRAWPVPKSDPLPPAKPTVRYMHEFWFDNDVATNLNLAFVWMYQATNNNNMWTKRFAGSSWAPDNSTGVTYAINGAQQNNLLSATNPKTFPPQWNAFDVKGGDIVEITFINHEPEVHPFHLHGHNFHIMGSGMLRSRNETNGTVTQFLPTIAEVDASNDLMTASGTTSRPIRDVISVPANGYSTVRFVANNPGVWALHCHIEWHLMSGLAVTLIEDQAALKNYQHSPGWNDLCAASAAQGVLPRANPPLRRPKTIPL